MSPFLPRMVYKVAYIVLEFLPFCQILALLYYGFMIIIIYLFILIETTEDLNPCQKS